MGLQKSTPRQKLSIDHERFTQCDLNPDTNQIDSFIPINFSPFDYNYWEKNLEEIKKDPHSKLLFLPLSYTKISSSFDCNTNPQLKLSFENHPFLLQTQIKNRTANYQQNHFDEGELWMLLYSLVKSQKAFSNLSLKVGDIHPHSIFINEEGYPRLACQFSWPNQKTNFERMYYDKKFCFLSPEQIKLCQQGQCPDICYSNTSEAFSIGMTLLSAGLLQSLDRICEMKTYQFNPKYLQYCINRWMALKFKNSQTNQIISYSDELKDIVKNLCNQNKNQRYLSSKVYEILEPHEQKIMNIERFELRNFVGIKKALSPYIQYSKGQDHLTLFNKYAGLSGNKVDGQIIYENKSYASKNSDISFKLRYEKIGNASQNKNSLIPWIKENSKGLIESKQEDLIESKQEGQIQYDLQKDIQISSNGQGKHSSDLLSKIQLQIKKSQQNYPQTNK